MADATTEKTNPNGVTVVNGTNVSGAFDNDNLDTIAAMRTRLTAISGLYTALRLDAMTYNDMVYAIRLADNPTTI
jgi:hypothetical protein